MIQEEKQGIVLNDNDDGDHNWPQRAMIGSSSRNLWVFLSTGSSDHP